MSRRMKQSTRRTKDKSRRAYEHPRRGKQIRARAKKSPRRTQTCVNGKKTSRRYGQMDSAALTSTTTPECEDKHGKGGRVFWDGYPEISMVLRAVGAADASALTSVSFIQYVGKCDRCGRFHVKCLTCSDVLSLPESGTSDCGHQCRCKPPWFWLASIELDGDGVESAGLQAVLSSGAVLTVDRRSLS